MKVEIKIEPDFFQNLSMYQEEHKTVASEEKPPQVFDEK